MPRRASKCAASGSMSARRFWKSAATRGRFGILPAFLSASMAACASRKRLPRGRSWRRHLTHRDAGAGMQVEPAAVLHDPAGLRRHGIPAGLRRHGIDVCAGAGFRCDRDHGRRTLPQANDAGNAPRVRRGAGLVQQAAAFWRRRRAGAVPPPSIRHRAAPPACRRRASAERARRRGCRPCWPASPRSPGRRPGGR